MCRWRHARLLLYKCTDKVLVAFNLILGDAHLCQCLHQPGPLWRLEVDVAGSRTCRLDTDRHLRRLDGSLPLALLVGLARPTAKQSLDLAAESLVAGSLGAGLDLGYKVGGLLLVRKAKRSHILRHFERVKVGPVLVVEDAVVELLVPEYTLGADDVDELEEEALSNLVVGEHGRARQTRVLPSTAVWQGDVEASDGGSDDLVGAGRDEALDDAVRVVSLLSLASKDTVWLTICSPA